MGKIGTLMTDVNSGEIISGAGNAAPETTRFRHKTNYLKRICGANQGAGTSSEVNAGRERKMQKHNVVLSTVAVLLLVAAGQTDVFAQGFGDYVAPSNNVQTRANADVITVESVEQAKQTGVATVNPNAVSQPRQVQQAQTVARQARVNNTAAQDQTREVVVTPQTAPATAGAQGAQEGGYVGGELNSAIVNPPANYKPTETELQQLDEFLARWEEFGRGVKRVSCNVHMREFDGVLQQNSKTPVAHTWGQFRFISPNKFLYHIKGEFVYTEQKPEGEWKEGQNEWMIVLNSKEFLQYDYKNKKIVAYPVVSEEQDMDLTMDNGQFPLFFVAKANVLKERFYLRIVTPESRQKTQVWIEAFPRYARDAQQFQSITVILGLKDLQPTYMRKIAVNGKSKTDLTFEDVQVNKGLWKIEGGNLPGWTRETREEEFSILRQQPVAPEQAVVQTPARSANVAQQTATGAPAQRRVSNAPVATRPATTANKATDNRRF